MSRTGFMKVGAISAVVIGVFVLMAFPKQREQIAATAQPTVTGNSPFVDPTTDIPIEQSPGGPSSPTAFRTALGFGQVENMAISPDRNLVAVASSTGVVVHDIRTLDVRWSIELEGTPLHSLAWTDDGAYVYGARSVNHRTNGDGRQVETEVFMLDAEDGSVLRSFKIGSGEPYFSSDGSIVLVEDWEKGEFIVYSTDTEEILNTFSLPSGNIGIGYLSWSPDRRYIAYDTYGQGIGLWDMEKGEAAYLIDLGDLVASWIVFSPDSSRIFISSTEKTECFNGCADKKQMEGVWQIEAGAWLWQKEREDIRYPVWAPDGSTILGRRARDLVRIDGLTGSDEEVFSSEQLPLFNSGANLEIGPDNIVLTHTSDGIRLYDLTTLETLATSGYMDKYYADLPDSLMKLSPNGMYVLTASHTGVILWSAQDGEEIDRIEGTTGPVAWSPDSAQFAVRDRSTGKLTVWQVADRALVHEFSAPLGGEGLLAWFTENRLLATGETQESIRSRTNIGDPVVYGLVLLDPTTGETVYYQEAQALSLAGVASSPDHTHFAYEFYDGTSWKTIIADIATGAPLTQFISEPYSANVLAWSPDSLYLAGISYPDLSDLWIWDAQTGERIRQFESMRVRVQGNYQAKLAWVPGGDRIITVREYEEGQGTRPYLEIWDAITGMRLSEGFGPIIPQHAYPVDINPEHGLILLEESGRICVYEITDLP